jgi:glycosyltransferase involved in cell wall biosynthesis
VLPPLVPCRAVVTIHDCIHLMFPQYLPNRLAHAYARANLWVAAKRAERIFTVSETSKADILRYCDVPAERVIVVYNAIDDRFAISPEMEAIERVRERYRLNGPFALYVGNIKPHKNLERLIDAFDLVRRGGFERLELLIIGDQISKYPRLRRAVDKHKLHKHVRFSGSWPRSWRYRLARAFVFPSLYEGFGLPPLEAMASGTPVVTSNVSSLPEVVGSAAVLVDPHDAHAIAEGIAHVLYDARLRRIWRRGLARAMEFPGKPRSVASTRCTWMWPRSGPRRHESGPHPRLADRHARRREGARSHRRDLPEGGDLHPRARQRVRVAAHRVAHDSHVVYPAPAGVSRLYRHYLPLFLMAVEQPDLGDT